MRKLLAAVLAAVLLAPAAATAAAPRKHELRVYSGLYYAVKHRHGARVPGRNIRRHGIRTRHGTRDATAAEVGRSIRTFRRWLAPPMGYALPGDSTSAVPAYAGGRWAIPSYIVRCESGGDYHAQNPSGAYGAYQIMPGTAAAYGCDLSTPGGQDSCAARIYAKQGAAPWVCG